MIPNMCYKKYDTFPHPTCSKCSQFLEYDFNYCPHCGEKIEWKNLNILHHGEEHHADQVTEVATTSSSGAV